MRRASALTLASPSDPTSRTRIGISQNHSGHEINDSTHKQIRKMHATSILFTSFSSQRTFQSDFFALSENSLDFFVGRPRLVFVFTECDGMASHVFFLGLTVRPGWLSVRHFGN